MKNSKDYHCEVEYSTPMPVCGHPIGLVGLVLGRIPATCDTCFRQALDDHYWECIKMEISRSDLRERQRRIERNKELDAMERVCVVCPPKLDEQLRCAVHATGASAVLPDGDKVW